MASEHRIVLARDTGLVRLDLDAHALCVRHRSYDPPLTGAGCRHMTFDAFEDDPRDAMRGRDTLAVVGLGRIITPGNRTREVFEVLFNLTDDWQKVSLDRTLFVSEPWRAWFHFGFVGARYREYTYSYLAESHWKAFGDGVRGDDPFGLEAIVDCGRGVVRSEDEQYFDEVAVETVALGAAAHAEYQELKAVAFDEEHTAPAIIDRLSRFAQAACPLRRIPTPARLFDRTAHRIVRTDLKVDEYLTGRLLALVELTNGIAAAFHGGEP